MLIAGPAFIPGGFSRVRSRPSCQSIRQPSSSYTSTLELRNRLGSPCRISCSPSLTRSSSNPGFCTNYCCNCSRQLLARSGGPLRLLFSSAFGEDRTWRDHQSRPAVPLLMTHCDYRRDNFAVTHTCPLVGFARR